MNLEVKTSAAQALQELGTNARSINSKLRKLKIKGARRWGKSCPLSNYLKVLGFDDPFVGRLRYAVGKETTYEAGSLPEPISKWVDSFDKGSYKEFRQ